MMDLEWDLMHYNHITQQLLELVIFIFLHQNLSNSQTEIAEHGR
jgi:hypothetical protein